MKTILIISCGPGLENIRNTYGHAIEWIQDRVDKKNFKFTSVDAYKGEIPNYADADAWILTGSSSSTYEDKDWIVEMEESIKKAISVEKPILGICFGHQLIAQALGGEVKKNLKGWDLGAYRMIRLSDDPLFNGIQLEDFFYNSHQDIVTVLPNGCIPLACNKMGNQAFRYGKRVYGVQFHPEFTHSIMKKYVEVRVSMGANIIDSSVPESKNSHLIINNFLNIF